MLRKEEELVAEAFRQVQLELRQMPSQSVRDSVGIYLAKLQNKITELFTADSQKFDRERFDEACDPKSDSPQPRVERRSRVA